MSLASQKKFQIFGWEMELLLMGASINANNSPSELPVALTA